MEIYLRSFEHEERKVTVEELQKELEKADNNFYIIELVEIDDKGNMHFEASIYGNYE